MNRITPDNPDYDEKRAVYNAMVDKHPALIAECASAQDVIAALAHARAEGMDIAVRAGGHSVAGMSLNDGGLVIDVRPMNSIAVDPKARRVRAGAGLTWAEFDRATQVHGLATTGGRVSTTGVAGLTLGGGSGWLERSFGLACDNLVSVDLVTADGRQLTASPTSNPELFWALHGGGGNFGVVTALEFALHPVGPVVLAGLALWPSERAEEVAYFFRDWALSAPEELGAALVFLTGPPEELIPPHLQGTTLAAVALLWRADIDTGRQVLEPLRALAPEVDLIDEMPYAEFQCMIDDPPGFRNYWTADYHDDFPDSALETFVACGRGRPSPLSQQLLLPWGGAVARAGDTPMTHRDAAWITHPFAVWERPEADADNIAWARRFRTDIAEHTNGGVYLNFIGDEGEDRIRAAFGADNYTRLQAVKAEYDPENVFHGNQNIRPSTAPLPKPRPGAIDLAPGQPARRG